MEVLKRRRPPAPQTEEAFMTWSDFYLICFLVGFGLSALALLAGSVHLHMPHLHFITAFIVPGTAHGGGAGGAAVVQFRHDRRRSWPGSAARGTCWSTTTTCGSSLALGVATLSGLGAASVVFWFLAKVLMAREAPLDPADYDMVGVLGKLSIPIRAGGTGELIYSQEGTRRVAGARSEDGAAIPKGAEVMVTRYEKGHCVCAPVGRPRRTKRS